MADSPTRFGLASRLLDGGLDFESFIRSGVDEIHG
jgi:hypothetical protein